MRTIHNFVQGTDEWKAHRRTCNNASDAWTVMNDNPHKTRREFLKELATGVEKEFDAAAQARLDEGHKKEALARPWAEEIIGEDLFPQTLSDTVDGLRRLSASFDGLNMLETLAWEHKTMNKEIEEHLKDGRIPSRYFWQMEQGLMISGAEKCLFMASNGTKESMLYAWYYPSAEVRKQLLAGWKQFEQDLASYEHVEVAAAPVAAAIDALPALVIQVEGKVLASNLSVFVEAAKTFIDGIKTELTTDQDFADADKMTKFLKDGEDRLVLVKSQAQAQAASIDELFRTIDSISAQMRTKRLALEKLVKSEKENRRELLLHKARAQITEHVRKLDERIGGRWMPSTVMAEARLAEAIKGLKSLDSMHSKLDGAVATAKLEANEVADVIAANRKLMEGEGHDYMFLFPDFASVCTKSIEDFSNLLAARIKEHTDYETARMEAQKAAVIVETRQQATLDLSKQAGDVVPPQATGAVFHPQDGSIVDEYLQLLAMSAVEKKALRVHLEKFVKYWQAKTNLEVV